MIIVAKANSDSGFPELMRSSCNSNFFANKPMQNVCVWKLFVNLVIEIYMGFSSASVELLEELLELLFFLSFLVFIAIHIFSFRLIYSIWG